MNSSFRPPRRTQDRPVRGWRDRVFSAAAFFFVSVFIVFVFVLIAADILYVDKQAILEALTSRFVLAALWMSIWTSSVSTLLALLFRAHGVRPEPLSFSRSLPGRCCG